MKIYYISIISLLLFIGCKNDDDDLDCKPPTYIPCEPAISFAEIIDTCFELLSEPNVGWNYTESNLSFGKPYYNLNNPDEFLYLKQQSEPFKRSFWKVNICNAEKSEILSPSFLTGELRWGGNSQIILLNRSDFSIYIMKDNGDSLTQITSENDYIDPDWMEDGEHIFSPVVLANGETKSVSLDMEGNIKEIFNIYLIKPHVQNNLIAGYNHISSSTPGEIGYLNIDTKEFIGLYEIETPVFLRMPSSLQWLDNENIIWTDVYGLYKVNINNSEMEILFENCGNRLFSLVSASPHQDGKVLVHLIEQENPDSFTLYSESDILLFDTNTGEQQIIDLN